MYSFYYQLKVKLILIIIYTIRCRAIEYSVAEPGDVGGYQSSGCCPAIYSEPYIYPVADVLNSIRYYYYFRFQTCRKVSFHFIYF